MTDWPTCPSKFGFAGEMLDCVLPKGHAMDGSPRHCDGNGHEWSVTIRYQDGREQAL